MKYEDLSMDDLGTRRQRPMYLSVFHNFRSGMNMRTYPDDPNTYINDVFLPAIDKWIRSHERVKYIGLDALPFHHCILGVTQTLDELHMRYGDRLVVWEGEYKYHRRLTNGDIRQITDYLDLQAGDVFVVSMPSCITTNSIPDFDQLLDYCYSQQISVHIDGAWFGQCRDFELDVSHPAIKSVSVSLSKAFGMGSQRIGIRYSRYDKNGPIKIANDYGYQNVSDAWLGVSAMKYFGTDYWWKNYEEQYEKVCADFGLMESDSIHVAWGPDGEYYGIRTPLRMLIEGKYDIRGTDRGLNEVERNEE